MSRPMTAAEVQTEFIDQIRGMIRIWEMAENRTEKEKMWGVAHSILSLIDGCCSGSPGWLLVADPSDESIEESQEDDHDWYPPVGDANGLASISGGLAELLYPTGWKK